MWFQHVTATFRHRRVALQTCLDHVELNSQFIKTVNELPLLSTARLRAFEWLARSHPFLLPGR